MHLLAQGRETSGTVTGERPAEGPWKGRGETVGRQVGDWRVRDHTRWTRRRAAVLVTATVALLAAACGAPPTFGSIPEGSPGADGPCAVTRHELWNPLDLRHAVVVYEPVGDGHPFTGGTCSDAQRPGVFIAHGYLGTAPEAYQGLIDHLVGAGFVVVFPGYPAEFDPPHQYQVVDTGFVLGAAASGRIDLARIGVVGHSFGGGMTPWLLQRALARGWGGDALWAVVMAPWFALQVGAGPIDVPERTRLAVINYDEDVVVDARIGIEMARSVTLGRDHVAHITVRTDLSGDQPLFADHLGPVSVGLAGIFGDISTDHYDRFSAWRTVDATAGCALDGRWCDTDLTDMGTWPDGHPVLPAVVSDDPVDVGPPALQECDFPLNPRPCP
jgi:acetyl esterase/lipase